MASLVDIILAQLLARPGETRVRSDLLRVQWDMKGARFDGIIFSVASDVCLRSVAAD